MQTTLVIAVTIEDDVDTDAIWGFSAQPKVLTMMMQYLSPAIRQATEDHEDLDVHWDVVGVMPKGVDSNHVMAVDRRATVTTA